MAKKDRNVLIIAFKFPPLGGMRVKRMAMFAKYLARRGYRVHVITVNWKVNAENTWLEDTKNKNIIIHQIASVGPHNYWEKASDSWLGKGVRLIVTLLRNLFYFVDEAQYWGLALLPFATRLITDEDITDVLCTGAPFMANYWAARLKKNLPNINLIQDFRDPWNDHLCAPYSRYFLFQWQKRFSQAREEFSLKQADWVVAVTKPLLERYEAKTVSKAKFTVITNGFDPDKYYRLTFNPCREKMKIIYIGNLFVGRDKTMLGLLESISELTVENPKFGRNFQLETYGGFPKKVRHEAEELIKQDNLRMNGYVSPNEALQAAKNAFALLLINADIFPYLVSGKVYEYIALKRPILAITTKGALTDLIDEGNLGSYAMISDRARQKKELMRLFELWQQNPYYKPPVDEYFINQFRYDRLVNQLESCFVAPLQ